MDELDVTRAARQQWLVKFPSSTAKVTDQQWVGKLTFVYDLPGLEREVTIDLGALSYVLEKQEDDPPIEVFTEPAEGVVPPPSKRLCAEGRVTKKMGLTMKKVDERYKKVWHERVVQSNTKVKQTIGLEGKHGEDIRVLPLPSTNKSLTGNKRKEKDKRCRGDRMQVENCIFRLFETQTSWGLKDLIIQTHQPLAFLKEILSELCLCNRGKYELKPEYRQDGTSPLDGCA